MTDTVLIAILSAMWLAIAFLLRLYVAHVRHCKDVAVRIAKLEGIVGVKDK